MKKRYDVITGRKNGEKTYWTNIGSAWESERGGMSVELSALPISDHEGRVRFLIVEPKERDEAKPAQRQASAGSRPDLDDDLPF
jgi:hypothetical protein